MRYNPEQLDAIRFVYKAARGRFRASVVPGQPPSPGEWNVRDIVQATAGARARALGIPDEIIDKVRENGEKKSLKDLRKREKRLVL